MNLPPRRYWRARTWEDRRRSMRAGLVIGLVAAVVLLLIYSGLYLALGQLPAWLVWPIGVVVVGVPSFKAELREALRRQAEDRERDGL